jgi:ER lumen protein retaining receptor
VVLHYSFAFEGSAFMVFLYDIQELLWTFSIYLESVAILPQLFLLQRTGEAEALTADYVFCLGGYRFLYIFNWIWRAAHTPGYQDWIVWVSGFIQTLLYGDFFYYYIQCKYYGEGVKLPQ